MKNNRTRWLLSEHEDVYANGDEIRSYHKTSLSLIKSKSKLDFTMIFKGRELAELLTGRISEMFWIIVEDELEFGNRIRITPGLRKYLSDELKTSITNISKYLKELKDKDIIRFIEYDEYLVNPTLIWKGELADREQALKLWLELK